MPPVGAQNFVFPPWFSGRTHAPSDCEDGQWRLLPCNHQITPPAPPITQSLSPHPWANPGQLFTALLLGSLIIGESLLLSLKRTGFWDHVVCIPREGNGTPLQYSCLENPMGGGGGGCGVAQSRTQLRRLSSSSSSLHTTGNKSWNIFQTHWRQQFFTVLRNVPLLCL